MRKFRYTAVNAEKKKYYGVFYAENESELRGELSKQNLFLISFKPLSDKTPNLFFSFCGKISSAETALFCRQFSVMLKSGISIPECLAQLKLQPFSGYMKKIIFMVEDDVKIGMLLSEAMRKRKKAFSDFFVGMIHVGEMSGGLEKAFNELADYYERETALNKKITDAFAYPVVLAILTAAVALLFLLFIIPAFQKTITAMPGVTLNALTRTVFALSDGLRTYGLGILAVLAAAFLVLFIFFGTKKGKYVKDTFAYRFGFARKVHKNVAASRFAKAASMLLSGGMNAADALETVKNVLGNRYAAKRFALAAEDVRRGASMSFALSAYGVFPDMLIRMIATGEKTGGIDEVLSRSYDFFVSQAEISLSRAMAIIKPALMGVMAVIIGLLFVAVYSPMLSVMKIEINGVSSAVFSFLRAAPRFKGVAF